MNGFSPLLLADADVVRVAADCPELTAYHTVPPLPHIALPDHIQFVERINQGGNTPVVIARIGNSMRLLKIVSDPVGLSYENLLTYYDQYPDREAQPTGDDYEPFEDPPDPNELFTCEKEAYAHLLHYGVCTQGAVPNCYGWAELSADHVAAIVSLPFDNSNFDPDEFDLQEDLKVGVAIKAIVLEYFPDAENLSIHNVTREIAEKAFKALYAIHTAYVRHNDVHCRNILVLPDGRVVWIDFDNARCPSLHNVTRFSLFQEFREGWDYMYMTMVS